MARRSWIVLPGGRIKRWKASVASEHLGRRSASLVPVQESGVQVSFDRLEDLVRDLA